jgi:hypothetical protein
MKAMEQVQQRIEELRVKLNNKYGTDNINIADGKINYPENKEQDGEANKKN